VVRPGFKELAQKSPVNCNISEIKTASVHAFDPSHPALQMIRKSKKRAALAPLMGFRPAPALRAAIIKWAEYQPDTPTLSQALGRLVELGLAVRENGHRIGGQQQRRARKMAADAIDEVGDVAANADDRASRKRHLLNGPEEFDRVRVDRSKAGRSARR
jgi:hypothetical protein